MWLLLWACIAIVVSQDCDYKCGQNGGCTVKYVGPPRGGKTSGSCFPQSFGGSCSGTPRECQDCNKVLTCGVGGSQQTNGGSQQSNSGSASNHTTNLCEYDCKSGGGCGAKYVGPFRSGTKSGSCFAQSFGGDCIGIPPECGDSCHDYCSGGELIQTGGGAYGPRPTTQRTRQTTRQTTRQPFQQTTRRTTQQTTRQPIQQTTTQPIQRTTTRQIQGIKKPIIQATAKPKPDEEDLIENVNEIEFEVNTIRESSLSFDLREDFVKMKIYIKEITELDEDLNKHERNILQNVTDVTKQLFYFHQVIENPSRGSVDNEIGIADSNEDCEDVECLQKKYPWLRVARSVSHKRFRRQDQQQQTSRKRTEMENVKNGQLAVDEADDSALKVKSLLDEYKQGLVDSSKCDAGKKKLLKILETESQNMKKQLEAATKSIEEFFDEKIKTISIEGTGKSWRFKRCELIWGREFVNEVGETEAIAEERADSSSECEKECDKYDDCVCWSFKEGVCHLKDEAYCEKLSDHWDINAVSAIAVQCMDRVEVCSSVTDTCEWKPAREIDLGSCAYKLGKLKFSTDEKGVCMPDGCPTTGPDSCAKLCATYSACNSWTLKKDTNACWLFASEGESANKKEEGWLNGLPCPSSGGNEVLEKYRDAGEMSPEDYDYIKKALESDPWKDAAAQKLRVTLNKYRAGNGTEKDLMQDSFDELHKMLNKEQKAEVYYAIQSDAEVSLLRLESVAHDPVFEPDPEPETACTANEDAGECKSGSTNSNTRKKHREMREIFELTKSKNERIADNKEFGAGVISLVEDQPSDPNDANSPSKRKIAEDKIKAITQETNPQKRKELVSDFKKSFLNNRGCCFEKDTETQKAITKYLDSSNNIDIESHKEKAKNALNRAQYLSDSDKEYFHDFLGANEGDQTEEGLEKRKKAKEKAEDKLNDVKKQRNRRGYQFGSKLVNKFRSVGSGTGNGMNPAKKPKHYRRSFARTFRTSSTTSKINGFANALNTVVGSIDKFQSGDALEIASGTMEIIASISAFAGPYGAAFSAVLGVVNIFMGMFTKKGPSQIEVMTNLINDQTEQLVGKIDEQTDILIETMQALNDITVNSIVTSIEQDSWRDMVNEMKGATNSLKTKKIHLEEYRFSCILDWIEIALESDLQHITRSLGKVSSFMTWYCYSRKNIPFCGEMIFQYVMLSNLRNAVRAETINIVSNSDIHNGRNKQRGLIAEYRIDKDHDKELLERVLQAFDQSDPEWKLLCFATCAFNKVEDKFENDNLEGSPDIKLRKAQKKFILQYMAKLGLKEDFDKLEGPNMCKVCYKDTPCKKGFERGPISKKCEKPRKISKGKHTGWTGDPDGHTNFLAQIPIECQTNEALTQFRLKASNNRLRFYFSCGTSHDNGEIKRSSSPETSKHDYEWYLYEQVVFSKKEMSCGGTEVLSGIKFKHDDDDDQMWWEFECSKVPYKLKCQEKKTQCNSNGAETSTSGWTPNGHWGYIKYMDRHNMDCGEEGFLKSFHYEVCDDTTGDQGRGYRRKIDGMKFAYQCCYVQN